MQISEKEGTACLRVLVAVAKADGNVSAVEMAALESAIELLPGSDDLKGLLEETIDLDAVLGEIQSKQAREYLVESAYALVWADSTGTHEEHQMLERLRARLAVDAAKVSWTQRLLAETKDTLL